MVVRGLPKAKVRVRFPYPAVHSLKLVQRRLGGNDLCTQELNKKFIPLQITKIKNKISATSPKTFQELPMLFFAQFLNANVVDSADQMVGKLVDFIATTNQEKYPSITAIVVKDAHTKQQKIISFSYVANLSKEEILLKRLMKNIEPREVLPNDIFLYRDVLDKQIVDVKGTRVVRVNDLQFSIFDGKLHVLGIDVSTKGLIRRIGLDRLKIFQFLKSKFIDWQNIQVVGGSLKLATLQSELVKLHPADLANIIEDLNPTQSGRLMKTLDAETAAKVFEELEPQSRHYILKLLDPKRANIILSRLPVDELVDYLKTLSKNEHRKIITRLSEKKKEAVEKFLHYEDNTAGGLMTTEFVKGSHAWTVAEAREHIREISDAFRSINFIYLVNEKNKFVGVVSLRTLLVSQSSEKLRKIMKKIKKNQTVHVDADIEHISEIMTKYNLSSVVVLDDEETLLGVVAVDDVMRQLIPHA